MKVNKFTIISTLILVIVAVAAVVFMRPLPNEAEAEIEDRLPPGEVVEELRIIPAFINKVFMEIYSMDEDGISFHLVNNLDSRISLWESFFDYYCGEEGVWREVRRTSGPTLPSMHGFMKSGSRSMQRLNLDHFYPFTLRLGGLYRMRWPVWIEYDRLHDVVYEFYWHFD